MSDAPSAVSSSKPRQRREPDHDAPKYVRRVKGRAYQARVWLGADGGSLNLGLFTVADWENWEDARWAAARASREFVKRYDGTNLCEVVAELQRLRFVPDCVLLPRVVRAASGRYSARVRRGMAPQLVITMPDEFDTPREAFEAFALYLERELLAGRLEATAPQVEILSRQFEKGHSPRAAAVAAGVSKATAVRVRRALGGDERFGGARVWSRRPLLPHQPVALPMPPPKYVGSAGSSPGTLTMSLPA